MPTLFLTIPLFKRHTSRPAKENPRFFTGFADLVARPPPTAGSGFLRERQYLSIVGRMRRDSDSEVDVMRTRALAALGLAAAIGAAGCGSGPGESHHAAEKSTPAPAPPTPDTTPIEALRTPAGMVLKLEAPTPAVTPTPSR